MRALVGCGWFGAALLALGLALPTGAEPDPHLWRHRLLVLVAPAADAPEAQEQRRRLGDRQPALSDRDLRIYQLYDRGQSLYQDRPLPAEQAQRLRTRLGVGANDAWLILIGKDGGVKRRDRLPVDLRAVFTEIDEMPMRREEIRAKTEQGLPVTRP